MATQVIPRQQGDDYQARLFWLNACQLFRPASHVTKVVFESKDVPYFDDVVVYFDDTMIDEFRNPLKMDCYQVKYHVTPEQTFGFKDLTKPHFISSKRTSILQRLHKAQSDLAPNGLGCRFFWTSPNYINSSDTLIKLVSNDNHRIRFEHFCKTDGLANDFCQVRDAWQQHLNLDSIEGLSIVLRPFRLYHGSSALTSIKHFLNLHLELAGLVPLDEATVSNPYDDLIRKLHGQGINSFTRELLMDICKQENLWAGKEPKVEKRQTVGIRSFSRKFADISTECDNHLCLLKYFDNRQLQEPHSWQTTIYQEVDDYLKQSLDGSQPISLILDCHSSISFACGYTLDTKSGLDISVLQHPKNGKRANWHPDSGIDDYPSLLWSIEEHKINDNGNELAIGISVTHDVANDLTLHVTNNVLNVGRALHLKINPSIGYDSIKDGKHAALLATDFVKLIRENATAKERLGIIHFYIAAPNALTFFLGQVARSIGAVQLYEYDFDRSLPGDYQPTLKVPM